MITERSKDFVLKEALPKSTELIYQHESATPAKLVINTEEIQKVIDKETEELKSKKNSVPDEQKDLFEKVMKKCKEQEIALEVKST